MSLKLIKTEKLPNGNMQETFDCSIENINTVSFEYVGTEDDLTNFFKTVIFDYMRKNKIID